MKVTETRLATLIDNLNTLICEDDLLTHPERETLVQAVAAIGAMKARVSMKKSEAPAAAKPEKTERKEIIPDPRFPNARQALVAEEETLLLKRFPYLNMNCFKVRSFQQRNHWSLNYIQYPDPGMYPSNITRRPPIIIVLDIEVYIFCSVWMKDR